MLIGGICTRIKAILGYSEVFEIPCFLVQTEESSYSPGVSWIIGYQLSESTDIMKSTVKAFFNSVGRGPVPWQLSGLF